MPLGKSEAVQAPSDKSLTDLFAELEKGDLNAKSPPSVKFLEWLHRNASVERDADFHHRVGSGPGEVARGNHNHDGRNSPPLFATIDIPADPAATTAALATWAAAINDLLGTRAG
jgi:hypothetical protein